MTANESGVSPRLISPSYYRQCSSPPGYSRSLTILYPVVNYVLLLLLLLLLLQRNVQKSTPHRLARGLSRHRPTTVARPVREARETLSKPLSAALRSSHVEF